MIELMMRVLSRVMLPFLQLQLRTIVDPLQESDNYGIYLYLAAIEYLHSVTQREHR